MDKSVGINPVVSILAITAFSLLFGWVGALLAIPVAAMLQILIGRAVFSTAEESEARTIQETAIGPMRNKLSLLRLEAHELADDVRKQVRAEIKPNTASSKSAEAPNDLVAGHADHTDHKTT